jgi:hypothetical protein
MSLGNRRIVGGAASVVVGTGIATNVVTSHWSWAWGVLGVLVVTVPGCNVGVRRSRCCCS